MKNDLIISCLYAFDKYRLENEKVFYDYFKRLLKSKSGELTKSQVKFYFSDLAKLISFIIKFFSHLVKYKKQRKLLQNNDLKSSIIIGIATNRISIKKDITISLQDCFRLIGNSQNVLSSFDIETKQNILIVDAVNFSSLWSSKKRKDNEYIIDLPFLIYHFFKSYFFNSKLKKDFHLLFKMANKDENFKHKKISIFPKVVIAVTLNQIIQKVNKPKAFLVTANSTMIEILRAVMIGNKESDLILESCHGISMLPTFEYANSLLKIQKNLNENSILSQQYIEQVPLLPFGDPEKNINCFTTKQALNPAIFNSYNKEFGFATKKEIYKILELQIFQEKRKNNEEILTFFGGTNMEGNFYNSTSFGFEKLIIKDLKEILRKNFKNANLIYVPHPANDNLTHNELSYFEDMGFKVIKESIRAYLFSDKCISLLSSCLYEINWLGGLSFTPMINDDRMFSKKYLDLLSHPKLDGYDNLLNELNSFIQINNRQDLKIKISKRIDKIFGVKEN